MKHIYLNCLAPLCVFAGLAFTACNLTDAKAAVASASSAMSSSGSVITEPGVSSAVMSSSSVMQDTGVIALSSSGTRCITEISDSTENYLAVWDSCRALYERVGKNEIVQFDYESAGFSQITQRFWVTDGIVDSSLALNCLDFDSEEGLCQRDTTPGQKNEIEDIFDMKGGLCDVQTDTSENCNQLINANFDTETGILKSVTFNFVNKIPYLAVDGNNHYEINNVYFRTRPVFAD